jgi:hypothetical protein
MGTATQWVRNFKSSVSGSSKFSDSTECKPAALKHLLYKTAALQYRYVSAGIGKPES